MSKPVLVIGATGRIGRLIVDDLVAARVPVRALTRRPHEANLPAAVQTMAGDLTAPDSLDEALDSVDSVFLLWTAPPGTVGDVVRRIAAASRRVVFLSAPHQTPHPFFQQPNPMAAMHAAIEQAILAAGLAWTFVRPGMFASNVLNWWGTAIRTTGVVRWPFAVAETAPIDERDIAAVAARVLVDDAHIGGDYVLTGPESLTQVEQVHIISNVIGRPLRFEELTAAEFRRETAGIWPPMVVDMLLAAWGAAVGQPAYLTSAVSDILGRPARTFRQWVTDHASGFVEAG